MLKSKISVALFFCVLAHFMQAQKEKITLVITYKSQYCGGARPSPEIIAEAERSKPYANKTIVIVSDKFKVDSLKTNDKGQITLKIKKGSYSVYEAWKFYKTGSDGENVLKFDKECLKLEWERYLFKITKTGKKSSIENGVEILEHCPWALPCLKPENVGQLPE